MAASNDRNKLSATWTGGDTDPMYPSTEPDNASDFAHDSAGVPSGGISNKFDASPTWGDNNPTMFADNDQAADVAHDGAGMPNTDGQLKTDMDMNLAPNKFPRQSYESKITAEEAQLT